MVCDRTLRCFKQSLGHQLGHRLGNNRQNTSGCSHCHKPRPTTEGCLPRHGGGSGLSTRSANDEDSSIGPLIAVFVARGEVVRLDQIELVFVRVEQFGRIADVGEDHVAGLSGPYQTGL